MILTAGHCVLKYYYYLNRKICYWNIFFHLCKKTTHWIVILLNFFSQTSESLAVLVGTNDPTKGGRFYKVAKYSVHEYYDMPRLAYDIAVVKLQRKIEFNEKVQPIELEMEEVPDGADGAKFFGWGRLQVRPKHCFY